LLVFCGKQSCFSNEQEEFEPKSSTPPSGHLEAILLAWVAACAHTPSHPKHPRRMG